MRVVLLRLERGVLSATDTMAQAITSLSDGESVNRVALDPDRHWDEAIAVLSRDESDRAGSFRDPARMQSYVYAHACLRLLLAERLGGEAAFAIALTAGPAGKPRLNRDPIPVHFSLSYRNGFVAIALGDAPLGVDVERIDDDVDVAGIARRFFTNDEQAHLAATASAARRQAFFALWTRKEALVKAAGVGIDLLTACSALKSPATLVNEHGNPRRYRVHELGSSADHALALAVEMPGTHSRPVLQQPHGTTEH